MASETDSSTGRELGEYSDFPVLLKHLSRILSNNIEYFEQHTSKAVYKKYHDGFKLIAATIPCLEESITFFAKAAPVSDFSVDVKGNGYRSLIEIVQHGIRSVTDLAAYCQSHRNRFYFRWHHYSKEVEAYANLLQRLSECLQYARALSDDSALDCLFPECYDSGVLLAFEQLDTECFYGRTFGFQYSHGIGGFLQLVCVAMASFAEGYQKHKTNSMSQASVSILSSGKYTVNPEMRAKQIAQVTRNTDADFCQAFWNLTESYGIQHVPLLIGSGLRVNRVFLIPPERFEVKSTSGEAVKIEAPCSWSGPAPVQVRLLSYEWRKGQSKDGTVHHGQTPKPKSDGLIFHIHGGGFVAHTSKSHEIYLRSWAKELGVPILSVDYSLSPEAPFPRASEECFFAYAWCLNNFDQLGTTGKYVCVAGDSAGGNLSVSLSMRAAEYGMRVPDSILAAYGCYIPQWRFSPSRLLSCLDPLLPVGVMAGCLAAYSGLGKSPFDNITKNATKSLPGQMSAPIGEGSKDFKRQVSADSFHSCPSSPHSLTGHTATMLNSDAVVGSRSPEHMPSQDVYFDGRVKNCLLKQENRHIKDGSGPNSIGSEMGYDSDFSSSENLLHPHSTRHSEDSEPGRCTSPEGSKHFGGNGTDHLAVHFHSDVEKCHVVNVVEKPGSPDGELLLFPLEPPVDEVKERGCNELPCGKTTSMSQVALPITKNPYMSPLLASDEMLKSLPPVDLLACTQDPLLDDTVEFAKRLRSVKNDVELYILKGLPHGFLNFYFVSEEAREGNNLCLVCLKRTLTGKRKVGNVEKPPVY